MNTFRNYQWRERVRTGVARRYAPLRGRQGPRNPQAAVFWRRRIVALMIGLAALALIAWAFTGALGGGAPAASRRPANGPAAGQGGAGQGGAGQGAGAPGAGTTTAPARTGRHGRAGKPGTCPASDVVLSLSSSQDSYTSGELPQFTVDVVATSQGTCTLDVGARHVALVVRSGSVRVWSSADCVQGAGDLVTSLQRGVPAMLPISWNRQASSPGCPTQASRMPAGTYTATAADGALRSNSVTFRMS